MSLRGIAKQSEAIPIGLASTIIPTNDNDHASIQGSVLLEAMPFGIVTPAFGRLTKTSLGGCLVTSLLTKTLSGIAVASSHSLTTSLPVFLSSPALRLSRSPAPRLSSTTHIFFILILGEVTAGIYRKHFISNIR